MFVGKSANPPAHVVWLAIDAKTGVLSGTPRHPGVYPVLRTACSPAVAADALCDARLVVVTVRE